MNFNTIFTKSLLLLIIFSVTVSSCAVKKKQGEITSTSIKAQAPKPEVAIMEEPPPPPPMLIEVEEAVEFVDQSIEVEEVPPPPPPKVKVWQEEIFKVVEQMPRFPGCEDMEDSNKAKKNCANKKLTRFIGSNISYPVEARKNSVQGVCVVTFIIEKDGTVSNAKLVRNIGGGCGEESLRVVNEMNKRGMVWTPGKQRGRPVRTQYNLPIKFNL